MNNNDKISVHQLFCLLLINLMGTSLPGISGQAVSAAGSDGWICILIATGLALLYGLMISVLIKHFPDMTLIEVAEQKSGRLLGAIIGAAFFLLLLVMTVTELRMFIDILRQTLLQRTPVPVLAFSMLLLCVYAAFKGAECRARMAEIVLLFILLPLLLLVLFALPQVEGMRFGPFFLTRPENLFLSGLRLSSLYLPLCLLLMGGCFVGRPWRSQIPRTVVKAVLLSGALNLLLFFLTVGCLGTDLAASSLWPLLQVMAVVDIPILEIERQDALLMVFWILTEFTLLNSFIFYAGITLQKMTRSDHHRRGVLIAAVLAFLLSLIPVNAGTLFETYRLTGYAMGGLFLLTMPLLFGIRRRTHV